MKWKWIPWLIACLLLLSAAGTALADEVYAETPLDGASKAQLSNIRLAAQLLDGVRLEFGEEFSFNELVGERSQERGFTAALNGRGVSVVGGGVAQTATTLYLALMQRDDIEYSSIYTYNERFVGEYVDSGYDAIATDYKNDLDFAFTSYYEGTLSIYMWIDGERLCCYIAQEDGRWSDGSCVGYSETPLGGSAAQESNIRLAAMSVDGWVMEQGDVFCFNKVVGPRSEANGYQPAVNGRGVRVSGGGVAQVASALYLALQDVENVQIVEKHAYGDLFTGSYVDSGEDAVLVDYTNGLDFSFVYWGSGQLTIYAYTLEDWLVCEIYQE